ncbi:MAG: flagellar hook assembly protein FlgD [Magnetospiraceae bacterium]
MPITGVESVAASQDLTQAERSEKKLAEDLDQFLTLLTTQLQHQDPLDPMDATEFTSQLVEFATVEQQIYANANLEKLIAATESTQLASLVNYIGMATESEGNEIALRNGSAEFGYELQANAHTATITIADNLGRTVFSTTANTEQGKHYYTWNGADLSGNTVEDGNYTVTVSALDHEGEPVEVGHSVVGEITSVSSDGDEGTLYMGDLAIPFEKVVTIRQLAGGV